MFDIHNLKGQHVSMLMAPGISIGGDVLEVDAPWIRLKPQTERCLAHWVNVDKALDIHIFPPENKK